MSFFIFILAIVILLLGIKLVEKTNPIRFFVIMWMCQIFLALVFQAKLRLNYWGLGYIEVAVFSSIIGSLFIQVYQPNKIYTQRKQINKTYVIWILSALLVFAFISPIQTIRENGGLAILINLSDLLETNKEISKARYGGESVEKGFFSSILLSLTYTAPLYGGYVFRCLRRYKRILSISTIFPGVIIALTGAVKMALITSVILWIAGYITYTVYQNLKFPKLTVKFLIRSFCLIVLFFGILFLSMMFRGGRLDETMYDKIQKKFLSYAIGHIPCFDQWFTEFNPPACTYGGTMFAGISNYLGIIERKKGLFQETYQIWTDNSGSITNIFTIFRVTIEDFGYIGSLLFFIFFGAFSTYMDKNLKCNKYPYITQVIIMGIWAFVLWSFATSFFAYTSYIVMLLIMFGLLKNSTRRNFRYKFKIF